MQAEEGEAEEQGEGLGEEGDCEAGDEACLVVVLVERRSERHWMGYVVREFGSSTHRGCSP